MNFRPLLVLIAALQMVACTSVQPITLRGLDGGSYQPLAVDANTVTVMVFISHECPIANGYAPTLQQLHASWSVEPRVRTFLVHCDPDLTAAEARQHAVDYKLPGTILLDPSQRLASACRVAITPEAVVYAKGVIAYRGRIDDQWQKLGSRAPMASQNDLADAVANVLNGEPVAQPFAKAVGCLLPEPRR